MRVRLVAPAVAVLVVILAAASPAAAAKTQKVTTEVYRVRQGDTLWTLARRHATTPERLAGMNGISPDAILSIGQRMKVPLKPASRFAAAPRARMRTTAPAGGMTAVYHVRQGDTLWTVARRRGTTPERLAALNGVSMGAILSIGQRLHVPAAPAASPVPRAAPAAAGPAPAAPAAASPPAAEPAPASSPAAAPEIQQPTPPAATDTPSAAPARPATLPSRGAQWSSTVVALSARFLGVRYRWGGTSPEAFDCSGFIYYVFQHAGVALPRTTYDMFDTGTPVPPDQVQAGDIVFFQTLSPGASHAGIYLGDGRFIHSSSGFGRVTITPMNHRYYAPRYLGARRF